jgi:hypothetical protein
MLASLHFFNHGMAIKASLPVITPRYFQHPCQSRIFDTLAIRMC